MTSEVADLAARLVEWLREQVGAAGARGTVVGLSGGVDSAVVVGLCQRAFGDNNLALILPCHSDPQDTEDAVLVAQAFGVPYHTVVLDGVYDMLLELLDPGGIENPRDLAAANLKPRLRMLALYYFANRRNYLVVGTSNLSERTVGYFTKYGDGGVDLLPLGNLVKRQVLELAAYLGVPERVLRKPPSAGLWAGQTDEGEMGLTYAELDAYLLSGKARPEVRERIARLSRASEHKRRMPPVAPA
ncbi:MAG: NAD(+) synthase [Clostridia bacterium]|jgi:NAD+ synthase|nr:NAD(+) synthase [Clostridia bacterium]MDH7573763.1 NAD(+) synthase [Clostridia bacterium]